MSFTNLYLSAGLSGASDVNAGSTTGGAAVYTSTSGNWSTVTNQFTPTDGSTPASSIAVGDYVSIYVNAASVTTFVAQVTVVAAGVNGAITVDATIRYGTPPTTNSGARSLKAGGTWNSEIVLAATGLASTTVPQSTKINIKGNLTIAANRTISMAGTTTAALWFSGYNTTPGDLDNDTTNTLAKPIWTFNATFGLNTSGAFQVWSGLSVVAAVTNPAWQASGNPMILSRIRVENTSSNAGARGLVVNGFNVRVQYAWVKLPATATSNAVIEAQGQIGLFVGVTAEGGGLASFALVGASATPNAFYECVSLNSGGSGWRVTNASQWLTVINCTVSNAVTDGVRWTATPGAGSAVMGSLFRTCGGYGINNASGTNTGNVDRACNDFYACSQGQEFGFGDFPAFFGQTDSSDPVTSATNMTPVVGSNARNNGFPGIFENETFNSYADIGAVRHQDPSGGYAGGVYGA